MRRRGRRRFRGTWFPNLGTDVGSGADEYTSAGVAFTNLTNQAGTFKPALTLVPLTFDKPLEAIEASGNDERLIEILGNEWSLRRVVGKLYIYTDNDILIQDGEVQNTLLTPAVTEVTAGLFVARAGDLRDGGSGADGPIGATSLDRAIDDYSPDDRAVIREPWIWRRQWLLGSELARAAVNSRTSYATSALDIRLRLQAGASFPSSTAGYGSVADGPHVDARTRRRIGNDDRLWLAVLAQPWKVLDTESAPTGNGRVVVKFDYRIFGALRKSRQRGAF